jgi:molecular chaperone GrpE
LSGDAIERILSDFRAWLVELSQLPSPSVEPPAIELHTLVAQFTALRHEVNLQTRAARSTLEQNGEALSQLRTAVEQLQEQPEADDELDPLLKAVVDVYDNLALALRQVERQRETIESPLRELTESPSLAASNASPAKRGLLSSLFGKGAARDPDRAMTARPQTLVDASKQIRSSFNGLIAGYRMSLARVERILEQYELTPIETVGEAFDPEYMEVVEVVGDSGKPAGTVMEEVRRGYVRDDVVFRYAQVKVAR